MIRNYFSNASIKFYQKSQYKSYLHLTHSSRNIPRSYHLQKWWKLCQERLLGWPRTINTNKSIIWWPTVRFWKRAAWSFLHLPQKVGTAPGGRSPKEWRALQIYTLIWSWLFRELCCLLAREDKNATIWHAQQISYSIVRIFWKEFLLL